MKKYSLQFKRVLSFVLVVLLFGATEMTKTQAQNITFADSNVKAICVAHWDTNGDGELSYAEAAAVTDLSDYFASNQSITSFDELQYFTGLTSIGAFYRCYHLAHVTIPNTVTSIICFEGCCFTSIIIPSSVTEISVGAFNWTSSLEQIIVEEGNPVYDSRENCNAIVETSTNKIIAGCKNTTFPSSVTAIESGAFFGDRSGSTVTIPSTIISLGGNPFVACGVLEQIIVEDGHPVYDSRNNCNAIIETTTNKLVSGCKNTVIPNTVTTIGADAFQQVFSLTSIVIPSSVTSIEQCAFFLTGLQEITIYASTPPLWHVLAFGYGMDMPVHIPCGTLSAYQNAEGWSDFTNYVEMCGQFEGALNGLFTINANGDKVYFSQGNLRYQASTNTWKFSDHQWDCVGAANANASSTYDGWIDLFVFGTSGYDHGAVYYQPWSTEGGNSDLYNPYGGYYSLYDQDGTADWGYNAISNGGNSEGLWHTPSFNEWHYILSLRNTSSGIRYAQATVNGVQGLIICPDDWSVNYYGLNNVNAISGFNSNVITLENWTNDLESHGAVFLPLTGGRFLTTYYEETRYHSSSGNDHVAQEYILSIKDDNVGLSWTWHDNAYPVRLVRPAQAVTSYSIEAVPNPAEGGTVTGAGNYLSGQTCTLTATANTGYSFVNWTENDTMVSTDATYTFTVTGNRSLVANFMPQGGAPTGALNGLFSVGENTQVYFSQGNLQYQASTNTWRFAEHQWDFVGGVDYMSSITYGNVYENGVKCDNALVSSNYEGWFDLFGWGTSGYDHGAVCYQPWSISNDNSNYYAFGSASADLSGQADWGYNAISNGGNQNGQWRTLSKQEWEYLMEERNTSSGVRFAKAQVNGVYGIIILPDDWDNAFYEVNNPNNGSASFTSNEISATVWGNLESHGALFLPKTGLRIEGGYFGYGECNGDYWSTTVLDDNDASRIMFDYNYVGTGIWPQRRFNGRCVRLVRPAQSVTSYSIEAEPNPLEGGTITGVGSYQEGEPCTLTATPNQGYHFVNWTKDNVEVSTESTYSFTVTESASYVANFELNVYITSVGCIPQEGGTIQVEGTGVHGSIVTLTAVPNLGYTFVNWTKNDEVVSTSPVYSFTITESASYWANFEEEVVTPYWTPVSGGSSGSMVLIGKIQIDGVDQNSDRLEVGVFCGNECRGDAIAYHYTFAPQSIDYYRVTTMVFGDAGDSFSFKLYDHSLGQELDLTSPAAIAFDENGYGTAFEPYVLNFTTAMTQTQTLAAGWSWYSTYIEQEGIDGLAMLENSLDTVCSRIQSRTEFIDNNEYMGYHFWDGTLTAINNEESYRIRTTLPCEAVITGQPALPENHPITVNPGWNWIGFPSAQPLSVTNALSAFAPVVNDQIKGRFSFTTYLGNYDGVDYWDGELTTLEPGQGYMYRSFATTAKTLVYQTSSKRELVPNGTTESNYYQPVCEEYAENMTVTAEVELDGSALRRAQRPQSYELAAFVGEECRGSVKLKYVAPLDRYEAFLMVFGEEGEELSFVLTDGEETYWSNDHIVFSANAILGNPAEPFVVRFGSSAGTDEWVNRLRVYPNPVERGERFSIGMNDAEERPVRIEMINALGTLVKAETLSQWPVSLLAPASTGIYTLKIVVDDKTVVCRRLIVK